MSSFSKIAVVAAILSSLSFVAAQDKFPEPITVGQFGYPHGHQILACKFLYPSTLIYNLTRISAKDSNQDVYGRCL